MRFLPKTEVYSDRQVADDVFKGAIGRVLSEDEVTGWCEVRYPGRRDYLVHSSDLTALDPMDDLDIDDHVLAGLVACEYEEDWD